MSEATHNLKRMYRFDLTKRLVAKLQQEEAVIGGIGHSNFDLWGAGHRPQNFYMLGSMGLAIPIALGVAIAQPARKTFALEGDGSLLMQLGCLATVATQAPKNLCMVIFDNGIYQITGGQPTPGGRTDYVAAARALGIEKAQWAADEAEFERLLDLALTTDGPHLIGCKLDDQKPPRQTERDPAQIRDRFMRGMGSKQDRTLG
jgi:thiamine pyrophosphate-dependent acetolactate synthase large subunit-like protein